jgi:hypothetical protein
MRVLCQLRAGCRDTPQPEKISLGFDIGDTGSVSRGLRNLADTFRYSQVIPSLSITARSGQKKYSHAVSPRSELVNLCVFKTMCPTTLATMQGSGEGRKHFRNRHRYRLLKPTTVVVRG